MVLRSRWGRACVGGVECLRICLDIGRVVVMLRCVFDGSPFVIQLGQLWFRTCRCALTICGFVLELGAQCGFVFKVLMLDRVFDEFPFFSELGQRSI